VREQLARERRRKRAVLAAGMAVVLLVVAGFIGFGVYSSQRPESGFEKPPNVTADRSGVVIGDGPVMVEVYLDYLCPACRNFEQVSGPTLDKLVAEKRIKTVYYPVAILDRYSTNEYSTRSAAGAGCAVKAGKFMEYTKALYGEQPAEGGPGHNDDQLVRIASAAGIPGDAFGACLRQRTYADWVTHVTTTMSERGVNGTPTIFVNGQLLTNATPERITAAVGAA
jgi:protein-disulfide isomerase